MATLARAEIPSDDISVRNEGGRAVTKANSSKKPSPRSLAPVKAKPNSPKTSATPKKTGIAKTRAKQAGVGVSQSSSIVEPAESRASIRKLSSNHVGPRLRERREALGVSLRQFARELDVSASFLSQLETGKAQPSVATLYSICDALNISVDDLFTSESSNLDGLEVMAAHSRMGATLGVHVNSASGNDTGFQWLRPNFGDGHSPVVTPADRKVIALDSGVTWERLTATTGAQSNFLFVRYDVGGSSTDGNLIRHLGTEYWYVMSGTLEVVLGFETYRLNAGDAISFDSSTPHRLSNGGDVSVEAIWFNLDHHVPIA